MLKDYTTVEAFWGMRRIQDIAEQSNMECFPVMEDGRAIGVLTRNDLIKAHPNRIAMDAMSGRFDYIACGESIWKAKEYFDKRNVDMLLAMQGGEVAGIVTKQILDCELGKHIDLLTGLNKSDYIYYKSLELLDMGSEISIIFFDVNNFGYIDKKFGHAVGDKILQEITGFLKANIPEGCYLCRFGGDEFALLAPYCAEDCKRITENLVKSIKEYKFSHDIPVSVSAGIAGGRRRSVRKNDMLKTVSNLVNIASLASTKAKKEKDSIAVGYCGFVDEVAI